VVGEIRMNLFTEVIRENLKNVLHNIWLDFLQGNSIELVKECIIDTIGPNRTPAVNDEPELWLNRIFRELNDRELVAFYIKLLSRRLVNPSFAEDANYEFVRENYRLFFHEDTGRWWFIDEGLDQIAYAIYEAVTIVRALGLNETENSLLEADRRRVAGEWELVVWKCSKAVEGVARHCLRVKMQQAGVTPPNQMPEMGRCYNQLCEPRYSFWNEDEPIAKFFKIIKDSYRNPTSHLDDGSIRPQDARDCNNEKDARAAFVLSHLVIFQMLQRL
jgi:hypothetical protein